MKLKVKNIYIYIYGPNNIVNTRFIFSQTTFNVPQGYPKIMILQGTIYKI